MTSRRAEPSPLAYARVCGLLYLVVIAAGIFGLVVGSKLIVRGDAAATASSILGSETLWRLGVVGALLADVCYVPVTLILYVLLKPVNATLSLLAAFFSLVGCAIGGVSSLAQLAPLLLLKGADYLNVIGTHQLQAEALFFLRLSGNGTSISLVYFGFYCAIIGWLIFRSDFLPKVLGVLLILGGACYLIDSFAGFLAPEFDLKIGFVTIVSGIAELVLCLWLIVKGVNEPQWYEKVRSERWHEHDGER